MPIILFSCLLVLIGIYYHTQSIRQIGGAVNEVDERYYIINHKKLHNMFDPQNTQKYRFGSWHATSFKHMNLFDKDGIWKVLKNSYGAQKASRLYPYTWFLPRDLASLQSMPQNTSFILKTISGYARKGLEIADNVNKASELQKNYDLAQILIPNPHLIKGYKYDIRMYLIVHYKYGILLYQHGYFYFSQNPYNSSSTNMFDRIGGIDIPKNFYDQTKLPQTTQDYNEYKSQYPMIVSLLRDIFQVYPRPLLTPQETAARRVKIFGIDIDFFKDDKGEYNPILIEMNSNPNLSFKNKDWKTKVVYHMLSAVESLEKDDLTHFTLIRTN